MSQFYRNQRLEERALALCAIPSVTGNEAVLANAIDGWARSVWPAAAVNRIGQSVVMGSLNDPRPTIALVGHLDTVPPSATDGSCRIEGDRLYGLGASDMKGALAVVMKLCEDVDLTALPVNLVVVMYEREEGPYEENGLGPILASLPELSGIRLAVVLEPTDEALQLGCVGSLHTTAVFQGQRAHAARPWQGRNAIHLAAGVLNDLSALRPREVTFGELKYFEVLSATIASGGTARNVVPDLFELNLNYRFAPGKAVDQAKADVANFLAGRATCTHRDSAPAAVPAVANPWVDVFRKISGAKLEAKQAWTDVARFAQLGIDAVNYGPGETSQAHQSNESASISALHRAYRVLHSFVHHTPTAA